MIQGHSIDAAQMVVATTTVTGLCAGTAILTLAGEIPVERLRAGDKVITRDSGVAVLRDITVKQVEITPIRILGGSLGHNRPERDMVVAPDAQLHLRDWRAMALFGRPSAMVPASRLIDGEFVAEEPTCMMTIHTLSFDKTHIVYCDGMEIAASL